MSNFDDINKSFNDALLNNTSMDVVAEPEKVAVAAESREESIMQLELDVDFKFADELKSVPSSSSSMFPPCEEYNFPPTIHISPIASPDLDKIQMFNEDEGFQTPSRGAIVSVEPTSSESQQPKRRRRKLDLVISDDHEKRPEWLPADWQVEFRRREGGATAGLTDRYYYEPGSRRQFRSKKEVLCYLETGARRRYKSRSIDKSNTGVNGTPSNTTGSEKRKRTPNFDYDNPPKKVTWKLNCFPEAPGSWTPFINGEMVPEHTRQEWDAAFTYHVHGVVASSSKVDEVAVNLEAGA